MTKITIDLTPTWEAAMRIHVNALLNWEPAQERDLPIAREIIRAGQLLDTLITERREAAATRHNNENCAVCVLRHHCERRDDLSGE